jgi:hypothetical protein
MSEVDLMHVVHRPPLPRLVSVSLVAATLAIALSLALASSLSNIGQPGGNTSSPAHHTAPGLTSAPHMTVARWATNPFVSLLSRALPPSWLTAR